MGYHTEINQLRLEIVPFGDLTVQTWYDLITDSPALFLAATSVFQLQTTQDFKSFFLGAVCAILLLVGS